MCKQGALETSLFPRKKDGAASHKAPPILVRRGNRDTAEVVGGGRSTLRLYAASRMRVNEEIVAYKYSEKRNNEDMIGQSSLHASLVAQEGAARYWDSKEVANNANVHGNQ